jgi:hypothetical protein
MNEWRSVAVVAAASWAGFADDMARWRGALGELTDLREVSAGRGWDGDGRCASCDGARRVSGREFTGGRAAS